LKRNGDKNGNEKAFFFPLFLLFFLLFPPSSFQFLRREMGKWEDKNECPKHAKEILQEQNASRKSLIYQGFSALKASF
jgi:hypothetical protein